MAILPKITVQGQEVRGFQSANYFQTIRTEVQLPADAGTSVIKMFKIGDIPVVVTSRGLFRCVNNRWECLLRGLGWSEANVDSKGQIWLATVKTIQREGDSRIIRLPEVASNDTILCFSWENDTLLQVGTNHGAYTFSGSWRSIPVVKGKRVNSISLDDSGDLWLATSGGLFRRMDGEWINMDDALMAGGWKRSYFSLAKGGRKGEMLIGGALAIASIAEDGNNWMATGAEGLPYGPATSMVCAFGKIWLGTNKGAISYSHRWQYFNGRRWLPDNQVTAILPLDEHTTWIATPKGISQIKEEEMTLAKKAQYFEDRIQKRHNRYGLISNSKLLIPGDLTTNRMENDDNDGLWTSVYLAAEAFRYAVTRDPEARKNAIRSYEALELLETVTGIPGFPARSFVGAGDSIAKSGSPYPRIWHTSADGKWKWLGATSSDEIVGHLFAIPLFYDLVADGELKVRSRELVHRIMSHIIDNQFRLVDLDGQPTKWGIWTPDSLNSPKGRWYERGLNSLQILSFLKTAFYMTKDPKFESAYQMLIKEHHYAENTLHAKMDLPFENSHSDDILNYLPYYHLFRHEKETRLVDSYRKSIQNSWNASRQDHNPAWNILTSAALRQDCDLEISLKELQSLPMEMIGWTMENSHRWDLPRHPFTDRSGKTQSVGPIPISEGAISKWNKNTHQYDSGSGGMEEDDGAYFLLPYWMARYEGFFVEQ